MRKNTIIVIAGILGLIAITLLVVFLLLRSRNNTNNPSPSSVVSSMATDVTGDVNNTGDTEQPTSGKTGSIIIKIKDKNNPDILVGNTKIRIVNEVTSVSQEVLIPPDGKLDISLDEGRYYAEIIEPAPGYIYDAGYLVYFDVSETLPGAEVELLAFMPDDLNSETTSTAAEETPIANTKPAESTNEVASDPQTTISAANKNPKTSDNGLFEIITIGSSIFVAYLILIKLYFKLKRNRF